MCYRKLIAGLLAGAVLIVTGCTASNSVPSADAPAAADATTAAPIGDELPVFSEAAQTGVVQVGVETYQPQPREQFVVLPGPEVLTPEEERALGVRKPQYDPLALYAPTPDPRHGLSPFDSRVNITTFGLGSAQAQALNWPWRPVGVYTTPRTNTWSVMSKTGAAMGPAALPAAHAGRVERVGIGQNPPSRTGSRYDRSRP